MRVVTLPFVDPILYKPVSVHFNKYNDLGDGFWTGKGWKNLEPCDSITYDFKIRYNR